MDGQVDGWTDYREDRQMEGQTLVHRNRLF